MSDLSYYVGNAHWETMSRLAWQCPNGGFFSDEFQGTPGMHSGMTLWSNDNSFAMLKHGSQTMNPYIVGVPQRCPPIDPAIRCEANICTDRTLDPYGCTAGFIDYNSCNEKYPRGYKRGYQYQ